MLPSDQDLMAAIRNREEEAFERLVTRYGGLMRAHLLRMIRDEAIAGDLLQESLIRVWNHAGQWQGRGKLKAWLLRIATNQALNHLQSAQRRREQPLEVPGDRVVNTDDDDDQPLVPGWMIDPTAGPDMDAEQAEQAALLRNAIDALPPEKRTVFNMAHRDDMDMRTIAETLGIPEGTAKSRLHYTMKTLLEQWKEMTTDEESS